MSIGERVRSVVARLDVAQRRRRWLGFPLAVLKKRGDDRAGELAALLAYYSFFSLFPLLLVLVTILGFVLAGDPGLQRDIVDSALARFPVIGTQLQRNVGSLDGSVVALLVGLVGALWAGMGALQAAQSALNTVWRVPMKHWPKQIERRLRAAVMLVVLGLGVLASAVLSAWSTFAGSFGLLASIVGVVGALALNVVLFLVAFRVLPDTNPRWRDLLPGAVVAGVAAFLLQTLGSYIVNHQLEGASDTYGTFAVVLGLLSWIYLQAQVTLLGAEINVVRAWRLWPRSLRNDHLTDADRRALELYARIEERVPAETVDVTLGSERSPGSPSGPRADHDG